METWEQQYERLANILTDRGVDMPAVIMALKQQVIELPSWAVGNSGTRYGMFRSDGAAATIWDKIDDCAEIQRVVGVCPVMASHVLWDVTDDGRYEPVGSTRPARAWRSAPCTPTLSWGSSSATVPSAAP